jgi:acyl dehydratase
VSGSLHFEDIELGMTFASDGHRMDAADIRRFANEFDPQPFHIDDDAGRASVFGSLVASGWHTAAVTMRLLVTSNPFAGGLIGSDVEVRWRRPTRPDEELKVFAEVVGKDTHRSRTDFGWVVIRAETRNGDGDVLQILTSRFLVPTIGTVAGGHDRERCRPSS